MELTDASLIVLLGVIAVALFGLLVAGVPRARRAVVAGALRAGQVLLLNVIVVALAGAALNDQYLFYSSWGDLFGSRSSSVQTHQGGTVPEVVAGPVHGPGLGGAVDPRSAGRRCHSRPPGCRPTPSSTARSNAKGAGLRLPPGRLRRALAADLPGHRGPARLPRRARAPSWGSTSSAPSTC